MKTSSTHRDHFHMQPDNEDDGRALMFTLEDGVVTFDRARSAMSAEDIERIAAALAEHRARSFDSRCVCPDHGYYSSSDSASGYKCSVCDPKPAPVEPEVAESNARATAIAEGEDTGAPL